MKAPLYFYICFLSFRLLILHAVYFLAALQELHVLSPKVLYLSPRFILLCYIGITSLLGLLFITCTVSSPYLRVKFHSVKLRISKSKFSGPRKFTLRHK